MDNIIFLVSILLNAIISEFLHWKMQVYRRAVVLKIFLHILTSP